jgi:hypothetical protein
MRTHQKWNGLVHCNLSECEMMLAVWNRVDFSACEVMRAHVVYRVGVRARSKVI